MVNDSPGGSQTAPSGDGGGIPFLIRLKAWWDGRDPHSLWSEYGKKIQPRRRPGTAPVDEPPDDPEADWPASRLSFMAKAWGPGFHEPGGEKRVLDLAKPLGLNKEQTAAIIGVGLGGGLRAMTETFDLWTEALEPDVEAAEIARELIARSGLESRAPIIPCNINNLDLVKKRYHAIFAKEVFYRASDKNRLFTSLAEALKDRGQLLFTDFIVSDEGGDTPVLAKWKNALNWPAFPTTLTKLRSLLKEHEFEIRIGSDVTNEYKAISLQGWSDLTERVEELHLTPREQEHLYTEAERTARCIAAIDAGDLYVGRFHVMKKGIRLLSDP